MANPNINTQQSGTILLTINSTDTENLDIHEWTKRENIGGFNWCLKAERNQLNGEPKMDLFIICNEDCTDKLWLAKVNISIEVKQKNRCPRRISTDGCYFHNGSVFELSDVFFNWNRVEDTVLKVELNVLRSNSKHRLMPLDTDLRLFYASEAENEQRDEEGVIAVNKHAMASISGYFQNLFFGNWSERRSPATGGTDSFTINEDAGFDLHAFSTMIYASMAMGWMVHDSKMFPSMVQDPPDPKNLNDRMAMKILKLSVKYDIPMMMDYSEKYLISQLEKSNFPKIELLEEAEQLGLQELKEHSLKSISPLDIADNFVRNAEILSRLGRRTQEELDNHLKERARKMRIEFQLNHIPLSNNAPSSTSHRRRNNMNDPRVNQPRDVGFDLDWQPQ